MLLFVADMAERIVESIRDAGDEIGMVLFGVLAVVMVAPFVWAVVG